MRIKIYFALQVLILIVLIFIATTTKADVFHGTGVEPIPTVESIPYVAEKGITIVRIQMSVDHGQINGWGAHQYFMAHDNYLRWLDHLIPHYKQHNIRVIINMAYPPGGFNSKRQMPMFNPDHWGNKYFVDMWKFLAEKYKDEDTIYGFDLINEPHHSSAAVHALQERATEAIRSVTKTKLVIHTTRRGRCVDFKTIRLSRFENVKYTCHPYEPHSFTHQGINNGVINKKAGYKYPSKKFPRSILLKELAPVKRFAKENGAESVYIGEAAVSIFTDNQSQLNWTRDLLNEIRPYNWTIFFVTGHWWRFNVWEPSHNIWMEIYKEFR